MYIERESLFLNDLCVPLAEPFGALGFTPIPPPKKSSTNT